MVTLMTAGMMSVSCVEQGSYGVLVFLYALDVGSRALLSRFCREQRG